MSFSIFSVNLLAVPDLLCILHSDYIESIGWFLNCLEESTQLQHHISRKFTRKIVPKNAGSHHTIIRYTCTEFTTTKSNQFWIITCGIGKTTSFFALIVTSTSMANPDLSKTLRSFFSCDNRLLWASGECVNWCCLRALLVLKFESQTLQECGLSSECVHFRWSSKPYFSLKTHYMSRIYGGVRRNVLNRCVVTCFWFERRFAPITHVFRIRVFKIHVFSTSSDVLNFHAQQLHA